ncbi:MAG: STAS domain-containing protein [Planctomycetia bacterium]|nr:STAS domain-containing protein [Planctomycetia bacterium]
MTNDLQIEKTKNDQLLVLAFCGQLNSANSMKAREEVFEMLDADIKELILDFVDLSYISSAGLRIVLELQKTMNGRGGKMLVTNLMPDVRAAFEICGLSVLIHLEQE